MKKLFIRNSFPQPALFLTLIVILNGITIKGISQTGVIYSSYLQEIKTDIPLPEIAGNEALKLFGTPDGIEAITTKGVFKLKDGEWSGKPFGSNWRTAARDADQAKLGLLHQHLYSKQEILPELSFL